jgi:putative phage-type endonuclease
MSGAPAIVLSPRDRWLAERRTLITASDVAAIIGEDPRRGPLAVWASKVGDVEAEETVPMRRGRRFEAAIGAEYGDQTGRPVGAGQEYEIRRHPSIPWLGATLDALTAPAPAMPSPLPDWPERRLVPLQLKMAIGSARNWKDEPPLGYVVQCQVEAACADVTWSALAALVGPGPLATVDLVRDDAFLAALIPELERFRWHVRNRIPPEADGKPGTSAAVRLLWPGADGETVTLSDDDERAMSDLESARARVAAAKETERGLLNGLHARLAGASFGRLPDGSYVRRARVERDAYEVEETSYVTLRRWRPRLRARG